MDSLNIIDLIENNPLTRLGDDYQSKLVNKIKKSFTGTQQQLFVSSFYCYLNYDNNKDFVVKLNDVWKWIGFSRIDHSKILLEKHFKKDIDYVVEILIPEVAGIKHGGNRKTESITMTINTFKKFCMKARTDKADEVHDYYIKLEELLQEVVNEESEELRMKLGIKNKELEIKDQELENKDRELEKLKKTKNKLYIGHTPLYTHLVKIGITEDLTLRLEQHRSSNTKFEYLFTYKTENAEIIEGLVKYLLKGWKSKKPEWFDMSYDNLKHIVDFVVMMYDTYNINESIDNLTTFVMKYNKNRLTNKDTSRQYFLQSHYTQFIDDCITVVEDNRKIPLTLMIDDFENWVNINNIPSSKVIRNDIGNMSTSFVKEIKSKIEEIIGIKGCLMSIQDKPRNMNYSKVIGWVGLELKSTENRSCFFNKDVYIKFIYEELDLTDDPRDKIVCKFLITNFLDWCNKNKYISIRKENIQAKGKYSNLFQDEFISNISNITSKQFDRKKTFRGVAGVFSNIQIKGIVDKGHY